MSLYQVTVFTLYDTGEVEKVGSGGTVERPVFKAVNHTTYYIEARSKTQAEDYAKKLYLKEAAANLGALSSDALIVETARDEE